MTMLSIASGCCLLLGIVASVDLALNNTRRKATWTDALVPVFMFVLGGGMLWARLYMEGAL